jgi:hypothetical protein
MAYTHIRGKDPLIFVSPQKNPLPLPPFSGNGLNFLPAGISFSPFPHHPSHLSLLVLGGTGGGGGVGGGVGGYVGLH